MSSFRTFAEYQAWYSSAPPGFTQSRLELETSGQTSWRKGCDKRRWSDYRKLWKVVTAKAQQMTSAAGMRDVATYAAAAAAIDAECGTQPCSYFNLHLKRRGAAGSSSSSQAAEASEGSGGGEQAQQSDQGERDQPRRTRRQVQEEQDEEEEEPQQQQPRKRRQQQQQGNARKSKKTK